MVVLQPDELVIQKLFRPMGDNGEKHTLKDLLDSALPEVFEKEGQVVHHLFTGVVFGLAR